MQLASMGKPKNTKKGNKSSSASAKAKKKSKDVITDVKKKHLKVSGRPSVERADRVFNSVTTKLQQEKSLACKQKKPTKVKKEMIMGDSISLEKTLQDFAKL